MKSLIKTKPIVNEIDRILCLPCDHRAPEDEAGLADLIDEYTERFKKPGGTWKLRPVQALALDTLAQHKGLLGSISVGGGKTLISALAPKVLGLGPFRTVLLTKAKLIDPWHRQFHEYAGQFDLSPARDKPHILSYAALSHPDNGPRILDELRPDLIIADEAHSLAGEDSSRRNRFEYYFERYPDTMLLAMSGTITKKSIKDYAHLAKIALKENNPLPETFTLMEAFCSVLDPSKEGQWPTNEEWARVSPLNEVYGDGRKLLDIYPVSERLEVARKAFFSRLSTTPGVVHTSIDTVRSSLTIEPITNLKIPEEIHNAIRAAQTEGLLPNEDELEDPLATARAVKQIAQGCFYYWDWPSEPDLEWLEARREKSREIRRAIKEGPREIDSPTLVKRAIAGSDVFDHDMPLINAWQKWQPHREKDPPPTKPFWISDYLIDDVVRRAKKRGRRKPAIVWYQHRYVAERLAEKGLTWYDPEDGRNPELADPSDGPIVLSIDSHSAGLNLQKEWSRNLILCPPSGGSVWEQLLGRTHRSGQEEDCVTVEVYAHVPAYVSALQNAKKEALFTSQANGQEQKILIADWFTEV